MSKSKYFVRGLAKCFMISSLCELCEKDYTYKIDEGMRFSEKYSCVTKFLSFLKK